MDPFIVIAAVLAVFGIAMVYPNIGLGGGFLHVPLLMFVVGLDKNSAVPISLSLVLAGALAALPRHYGAKAVDLRLAGILSSGAVVGAILGVFVNLAINKDVFQWLFALTIMVVCARMVHDLYKGKRGDTNDDSKMCGSRLAMAFALSILAGLLGSTFGIGGGLVYVPVMIYLLCRRTKLAVGTSTLIIVPTALVGLATYSASGAIHLSTEAMYCALLLVPTALAGAYIGSKFCVEKLSSSGVKLLFISLALVVAIAMIVTLLV
jgi:uncharacterized membrane protein YfcA